jgi:leucyl aminopeptidase
LGAEKRFSDNSQMPTTTTVAPIACVSMPLAAIDTDILILPWFEGEAMSAEGVPAGLDAATGAEVTRALSSREFTGKPFELFMTSVTDRAWRARRLLLVGSGPAAAYRSELARQVAAAAGCSVRTRRVTRAAFVLRRGGDVREMAQAIAEGLTLSEFNVGMYKTADPPPGTAPSWTVALLNQPADVAERAQTAVDRGRLLAECSNLARELANEPGNTLTPREFARRAGALASDAGVGVEILDEHRIAELGMGLLLGVARGSNEPPRLLVMRHDPPGAPAGGPVLGLVGKGITFDTGGISIKPADGMDRMKDDMAGGAAVACAMRAISLLQAPVRVVGVVPTTENMPGGRAVKPGDILKSAAGRTVEVLNTDAEGRLILGDGLWYAQQLGATHLVDVATLTGAIVVALGKTTSGLFGTPPEWVEHVRRVATRAGDRVWPMPLFDDYKDQLKSEIADFTNTGGRPGGSITAALFLKEFVSGRPWVHMDIAGTAWAEDARPYLPKGPSGVAVRTLAELAFTSSEWNFPV